MATWYIDPVNGSPSADGTSFANRKTTMTGLTFSAGDTVKYIESGSPTSLGINGTWTNQSATVTLASAVTANITTCDSNWTASTNVTCSSSSGFKREGTASQQMDFASGFTTGKAAYFTISNTDYSAYRQISFWFYSGNGTINANTFRLSLCSDTTGDIQVDNFDIDFDIPQNRWVPITINKGSALGSSIQSIALYCQSDPGTAAILFDNIFAVKSASSNDSLSLNSLIGKNTGNETWWAIKSINGTTVILDSSPASSSSSVGYSGTSETVTTYKRNTAATTLTTGTSQSTSSSGSSGNTITISGGWNSTDMTTQTSETWLDGRHGGGTGIQIIGDYITLSNIGAVRYNIDWEIDGKYIYGTILGGNNSTDTGCNLQFSGNNTTGLSINNAVGNNYGVVVNSFGNSFSFTNLYGINSNAIDGFLFNSGKEFSVEGEINASNNGSVGIRVSTGGCNIAKGSTNYNGARGLYLNTSLESIVRNFTASNNITSGLLLSGPSSKFYTLTTSGNGSYGIDISIGSEVKHYLYNASISEGTKINGFGNNIKVYSQNEGGTLNNNYIYTDGGQITVDTSDPHTPGGLDWKLSPTSSTRTSAYPLRLSIARIAVNSGSSITFNAYCKKTNANNVSGRLVIYGGYVPGIDTDLSTTISGTSYSLHSLTFTPTQKGVVEVFAEVWASGGTSDSIQIADISLT